MSTTLLKNVASQRVRVYAYTPADGNPKTGDAANLTCYIAKDYGAVTALTDTSATEEDATNAPGYYWFDITQTESNADNIMVTAKSSTAGVKVLGAPAIIGTRPATGFLAPATAGRTLVVDAAGLADANTVKVGPSGSGTAQTAGDIIGDTNDIQTRLPAALVSGRMDCSVGAMAANTLTAAATAADFGAEIATAIWTDTTAGDFTVALSIGKSIMNGVSLGTGLTIAAVSGAVGSVTGAVGSVTGNVGGNVVGSVGSISGVTFPSNFSALLINASGHVSRVTLADTLTTYTSNTPQTGDNYARLGAPAGASVSADIAAVKTDTGNLVTRITANLFSGITKLAEWLGAIAGKQASDATAQTEMRATGAGSGSYDATTDSQEAIRDRGDAAWVTGGASSVVQFIGCWTKSSSTYYVSFFVVVGGQIIAGASLSALTIEFYDEDGTALTFSGSLTAAAGGVCYASGTLTTAVTSNRPVFARVGATYSGTAYTSVLPGAQLA